MRGVDIDGRTGCAHYRSPRDVVAIRMACCGDYYACKDCHEALSGHPIVPWPRDRWTTNAVLCGVCGAEMTIDAYLACGSRCPACDAPFNPGCRHHHRFYFET